MRNVRELVGGPRCGERIEVYGEEFYILMHENTMVRLDDHCPHDATRLRRGVYRTRVVAGRVTPYMDWQGVQET